MNNKKILITGSSGFMGRHFSLWMKKFFPHAKLYRTIRNSSVEEGQEIIDLSKSIQVKEMIERINPEYIFHLAGQISATDWDQFYDANVKMSMNILNAVKETNLSTRVILVGSAAEYGNPSSVELPLIENRHLEAVSLYGLSKICQTNVARYYHNQGVYVILARLFNVYGAGISQHLSIGSFLSQIMKIKNGELPPVLHTGNLKAKRDYLYIDDVCSALVCLAERGTGGEVYNVCSGQSVSMEQILDRMIHAAGIKAEIIQDPTKSKHIDVSNIYGSNKKIADGTGWKPLIPLEEGISRMMVGSVPMSQ